MIALCSESPFTANVDITDAVEPFSEAFDTILTLSNDSTEVSSCIPEDEPSGFGLECFTFL